MGFVNHSLPPVLKWKPLCNTIVRAAAICHSPFSTVFHKGHPSPGSFELVPSREPHGLTWGWRGAANLRLEHQLISPALGCVLQPPLSFLMSPCPQDTVLSAFSSSVACEDLLACFFYLLRCKQGACKLAGNLPSELPGLICKQSGK